MHLVAFVTLKPKLRKWTLELTACLANDPHPIARCTGGNLALGLTGGSDVVSARANLPEMLSLYVPLRLALLLLCARQAPEMLSLFAR